MGRFERLQVEAADRADTLRQMFAEVGCGGMYSADQKVRGSKLPNLICTLPGISAKTIVVTAHYDKVKDGEGALDNWSGAAMLSSLFESLSAEPRTLTFVFLLTTDEEKGLIGSKAYWQSLPKEDRHNIVANVNIDCVGLPGAIYVWSERAGKNLLTAAAAISGAMQIPLRGMNISDGDSDSRVFLDNGVPVIDFHAIQPNDMKTLHSKNDVRTVVDQATYAQTHRLIAGFLALLDAQEEVAAERGRASDGQ